MKHDSQSYKGARYDLVKYMDNPKDVLDIGCNTGNTGALIKNEFGEMTSVYGVDYNYEVIQEAEKKLDVARVVDLNAIKDVENFFDGYTFDHIIIADVLEHILQPKKIVEISFNHLAPRGKILISLPNTGFFTSFFCMLKQSWPRNSRGIYDKTHLTIYMKNNLIELNPIGGNFKILERKYRFKESGSKLDFLAKYINYLPYFRNFFTFQFLIEISKK